MSAAVRKLRLKVQLLPMYFDLRQKPDRLFPKVVPQHGRRQRDRHAAGEPAYTIGSPLPRAHADSREKAPRASQVDAVVAELRRPLYVDLASDFVGKCAKRLHDADYNSTRRRGAKHAGMNHRTSSHCTLHRTPERASSTAVMRYRTIVWPTPRPRSLPSFSGVIRARASRSAIVLGRF